MVFSLLKMNVNVSSATLNYYNLFIDMKKLKVILIIVLVALVFWAFSSYNQFVTLNQKIDSQWAQVETQYQRRFDLIPNLVKSAEGVMNQEKQVFSDLANARSQYSGAKTVDEKSAAASQLESSLGRLLVIVENYPQLKSNETVNKLMDELSGTENRIAVERKRFNEEVTSFNLSVIKFPGNILANIFGFKSRPFFESDVDAKNAPQVDFNQ